MVQPFSAERLSCLNVSEFWGGNVLSQVVVKSGARHIPADRSRNERVFLVFTKALQALRRVISRRQPDFDHNLHRERTS